MKRLGDLSGKVFGYLTVLGQDMTKEKKHYLCQCKCGKQTSVSPSNLNTGHTKSCGCYNKERLSEVHTGRAYRLGQKPGNWVDRTNTRHHKLLFLSHIKGTHWLCLCDCGNETRVSTLNLKRTTGCKHCANRKDITGEKIAFLTAVSMETGTIIGRHPLWLFKCDCGNEIQGTVREFHKQDLRSCGCHGNAHSSWMSMMDRCYSPKNKNFKHYGGRGITVCSRWHKFEEFLKDMGECPKRHSISRKQANLSYNPKNCVWEHITLNTADTHKGKPTKPGLAKGATPREYIPKTV